MLDKNSFNSALKELYVDDHVVDLTYKDRPFLGMIPKREDFYGRRRVIPVYYANPQGRSASFAQAKKRGALSSSLLAEFDLTRVSDFGYITIDNETMEASENDKGAFMRARQAEIDGIFNSMAQSQATAIAGDGWGAIGQIKSGTAVNSTTLTLSEPNDVVNFEVGMELAVAAATDTGNVKPYGSSANGLIITKVNRTATSAQLTFGFNVNDATNGVPTIAAGDYLFVKGDREEASSPTRQKIAGVRAWIPDSDPDTTLFFGCDRSKDPTRLAGLRADMTGYPIEEALQQAANLAYREGAVFGHYFINPMRLAELTIAMGSRTQWVDVQVGARIGYRGVKIVGPQKDIIVMPDRTFPYNRAMGLEMKTWELHCLKKPIRIFGGDTLDMLRLTDNDGVEVRVGYRANVACTDPSQNINVKLA